MEALLKLLGIGKSALSQPAKQLCGSAFLAYEKEWGRKVQDQFNEGVCDISKLITNIKVLTPQEKGSQSYSIIVTGNTMPTEVERKLGFSSNIVLKISFPNRDSRENGLQVEEQIYRVVTSMLLEQNHTPCLVRYLGTATTESYKTLKLPSKYNSIIDKFITSSSASINTDKPPIILCTEMSHGQTLYSWLHTKDRNHQDIVMVMFQVFYTLNCFERVNLYHNDLHGGNIFVEEMPFPITMYFKILGGYIRVITKYIPKIYDYDNASAFYPGVERNVGLDGYFCPKYSMCNFPPRMRDTYYTLLSFFSQTLDHSYHVDLVDNFFIKVCDYNWLKQKLYSKNNRTFTLKDEKKIKDFNVIFQTLVDYPESGLFYYLDISTNTPKNLVFSLPKKIEVSLELTKVKIENLPKTKPDYDTDYSYIEDILKTWYGELDSYKSWRDGVFTVLSDILMRKDKKLYLHLPYIIRILMSPAFYDIPHETREKVLGKDVINNIYYALSLLGGKIPMKIYIRKVRV